MNFLFGKYEKKNVASHSFLLRRKSIDSEVFDYVFNEKYHRPYKQLGERPIILDLGTNIGLSIIDFKILAPDSIIYGFEMDNDNYKLACKNTMGLTDVFIFNKAVWFEGTTFTYTKNGNFDAYKLGVDNSVRGREVTVSTISIDQIIRDNKLTYIDYVKMDIEGAELEVFEASVNWLKIVKEIKIEVHYPDEKFDFFFRKLKEFGFTVLKDTHHWSTIIAHRE